MLKKVGMVGVGVAAALVTASPLASASEGHHEGHKGHEGHHSSHEANVGNTTCAARSGDVAENETKGFLLGVGPVLDGNAGQVLSCNSFLNDVLSHNDVNIANGLLG